MNSPGYQTGKMRHIHEVQRADLIGDLAHARKVDNAGISATSSDDELGSFLLRELFQIIVVNPLGFFGHSIRNDAIGLAREVQVMSVREVSAMSEIQTQDCVSRLQDGSVGCHIGLR